MSAFYAGRDRESARLESKVDVHQTSLRVITPTAMRPRNLLQKMALYSARRQKVRLGKWSSAMGATPCLSAMLVHFEMLAASEWVIDGWNSTATYDEF